MENIETIEQNTCAWKHVSSESWNSWHWQLENSLREHDDLLNLLRKHGESTDQMVLTNLVRRYRFRVTPYYLSLIDWRDTNDPIRRQCIPDLCELEEDDVYSGDPFAEMKTAPSASFVHRYPDRVLLVATNSCAMYCRHCTRKNTLDDMQKSGVAQFDQALAYIAQNSGVR